MPFRRPLRAWASVEGICCAINLQPAEVIALEPLVAKQLVGFGNEVGDAR